MKALQLIAFVSVFLVGAYAQDRTLEEAATSELGLSIIIFVGVILSLIGATWCCFCVCMCKIAREVREEQKLEEAREEREFERREIEMRYRHMRDGSMMQHQINIEQQRSIERQIKQQRSIEEQRYIEQQIEQQQSMEQQQQPKQQRNRKRNNDRSMPNKRQPSQKSLPPPSIMEENDYGLDFEPQTRPRATSQQQQRILSSFQSLSNIQPPPYSSTTSSFQHEQVDYYDSSSIDSDDLVDMINMPASIPRPQYY